MKTKPATFSKEQTDMLQVLLTSDDVGHRTYGRLCATEAPMKIMDWATIELQRGADPYDVLFAIGMLASKLQAYVVLSSMEVRATSSMEEGIQMIVDLYKDQLAVSFTEAKKVIEKGEPK